MSDEIDHKAVEHADRFVMGFLVMFIVTVLAASCVALYFLATTTSIK